MCGMSRTPRLTLTLTLLLALAATVAPALDALSAEPPAAKARVARLSLDDAIRELELVRPPRPKVADDFTIPTADGKTFRLSSHRGRPVFVNFWATWCPPCLDEMPAMERLWRAQKDAGLVMLAVTVDVDPKLVSPFLGKLGLTFAVGLDTKMELAQIYGVRALPSSFLIDREGRLAAVAIGPRVWDNVAAHSLIERLGAR